MHPMYHRQVYINDILDITYNILIRNLRAIPTMLNLVDRNNEPQIINN